MKKRTFKSIPTAAESGEIMVYVAEAARTNGDSFELIQTFDLSAARDAVRADTNHLTPSELANTAHCINGWVIPVESGETAQEAYRRWSDDLCWLPDPDFYEAVGD